MEDIAQASSVQRPTNDHLRFGILAPDQSHLRASVEIGQERIASSMYG